MKPKICFLVFVPVFPPFNYTARMNIHQLLHLVDNVRDLGILFLTAVFILRIRMVLF